MKTLIKKRIAESIHTKQQLIQEGVSAIERAASTIITSLRGGGTLFVFGNGGSASDSQHIVAELVGRFKKERAPLPAIALTTNPASLTAIANDYGYEASFSRQLDALGSKGDCALGISTSGNSANVIAAISLAKKRGMKTIALLGGDGGKLKTLAHCAIIIPSSDTPRIQEAHIMVGHILCEIIEDALM